MTRLVLDWCHSDIDLSGDRSDEPEVARTERVPNNRRPAQAKHVSDRDQTVARETRAKSGDAFRSPGTGDAPAAAGDLDDKPLSLGDLGIEPDAS